MDISKDDDMKEVYTLLYENYVEDEDGDFRFNYSIEFLRWALHYPKQRNELIFGIRDKNNNNILVGFITGIVLDLNIEDKIV